MGAETVADVSNLRIRLEVNGEVRQDSNTSYMIFPLDELISHISHIMTLHPGDIIAVTPGRAQRLIDQGIGKKVGVKEREEEAPLEDAEEMSDEEIDIDEVDDETDDEVGTAD